MIGRAAALAVLLAAGAAPAVADELSEALLRDFVQGVDDHTDWSASASVIRSEGDNTIAEGLVFSRENPKVSVGVERLRLLDLSEREVSGFVASEIELTGAALVTDYVDYAMPSGLASDVELPSFAGIAFDPQHLMTSVAQFYAAAAEGVVGEVAIPELNGTQRVVSTASPPPEPLTVAYRNIVMGELRGGMLDSLGFGPLEVSGRQPDGADVRFAIENVRSERLDLGAFARILDERQYRDGKGDGIWRPLASSLSYTNIAIQGEEDVTVALGEFAVENLDGRQLEEPPTAIWDRLLDPAVAQELKDELAVDALKMFAAWRVGTVRLAGMTVQAPAEQASFSLDGMTMTGLSDEGIDSILLKSMRGEGQGGFGSLESLELAGLVFPDIDAMMQFAALEADAEPSQHTEVVRETFAALPRLSHFGISGFSGGKSAAEAVKVGAFSLDFADWNQIFAGATDMRLEGVEVPRSLIQLDAETSKIVDTLGFERFVVGMSFSDRWSPQAGTDEATWTFSMQDAADVALSYTLTGLTMDWITAAIAAAGASEDSEAALIAMYSSLGLGRAALKVTDASLLDRAFGVAAQKQNLTVDGSAYREQMRGALPFLLSAALPTDLSKLLSTPLQEFLAGGKTLVAEIAPPEPIPLPNLVAAASADPMKLPGVLGLTLRTEAPAR